MILQKQVDVIHKKVNPFLNADFGLNKRKNQRVMGTSNNYQFVTPAQAGVQ